MFPLINKFIYISAQGLRELGVRFNEKNNPKVQEMREKINQLGAIKFEIEFYPDGSWTAESVNINGIITGSKDSSEINFLLKDAIFTFFEIPPYLCNDNLIKADNEPVTVTQRVYA